MPAKDLILHLLVRDSSTRLDAEQVLAHPWIVNGGSYNALQTPSNLKRKSSINNLENFASRAIAVNKAIEENDKIKIKTVPIKRGAILFNISYLTLSSCSLLQRRSKMKYGSKSKFSSIDELGSDFFMRTIC